jgi:hypothetical protein
MTYPASIEVTTPERLDRWRPLVQWILAIPHLIVAGALQYAAEAVAIVSWFIILFTGKLPQGLADFQVMVMRYNMRAWAYAGFLHAEYPPFEFEMSPREPGGTPVDVDIEPALDDRNRLTVGLRIIWAIPALLFAVLIGIVGALAWFVSFFVVLFTGRWSDGLRTWVMHSLRVQIRVGAYLALLTDEYPPFALDTPSPTSPPPAPLPPPAPVP